MEDSPLLSNRTYTLRDVRREDDGTRLRCIVGDLESNEAVLSVYGENPVNYMFTFNVYRS